VNFKIHRGADEIGGTCLEVWTDTTRIVIDICQVLSSRGLHILN